MSSGDSLMDSPVVPCASMDGTEPRELNPCSQGHTASVRVSELGSEPRVSGSQLPRCAARGAGGVGWGGNGGGHSPSSRLKCPKRDTLSSGSCPVMECRHCHPILQTG